MTTTPNITSCQGHLSPIGQGDVTFLQQSSHGRRARDLAFLQAHMEPTGDVIRTDIGVMRVWRCKPTTDPAPLGN